MKITDIAKWLNSNGPFDQGAELYNQFGTSEVNKILFKSKNPYTTKKLREALEALLQSKNVFPINSTVATGESSSSVEPFKIYSESTRERINPDLLPEELKAEYYKLGDLYKKISYFHNRLDLLHTDKQRFDAAKEIVNAAAVRRGIFMLIDDYMKNGSVVPIPVKSVDNELTPFEASEMLKRVSVQCSKLKDKPQRAFEYRNLLARKLELKAIVEAAKKGGKK